MKSVRTVYSYNNVDAGFTPFTILSSNFLNQPNLLLLEQYFGSFNELTPSLCDLKQPETTQRFHHPVNADPYVHFVVTLSEIIFTSTEETM